MCWKVFLPCSYDPVIGTNKIGSYKRVFREITFPDFQLRVWFVGKSWSRPIQRHLMWLMHRWRVGSKHFFDDNLYQWSHLHIYDPTYLNNYNMYFFLLYVITKTRKQEIVLIGFWTHHFHFGIYSCTQIELVFWLQFLEEKVTCQELIHHYLPSWNRNSN